MRKIKANTIYKHFKGNNYLVLGFATDSETLEKVVIYQALYDDCKTYVRPYEMFASKVDQKNIRKSRKNIVLKRLKLIV